MNSIDEVGDEMILCHSGIGMRASKLQKATARLRLSEELAEDEDAARFAQDHCLDVEHVRRWLKYYRNWQRCHDRAIIETYGQRVCVTQ